MSKQMKPELENMKFEVRKMIEDYQRQHGMQQ